MSRAQIVVLALIVMHLLLGALCVAAARSERSAPALRLWGLGLLIYAVGLLTATQGLLPAGVSIALGNALMAWAPIVAIEGVLAHTRFRLSRRWTYSTLAIVVATLVYGSFAGEPGVLISRSVPLATAIATFVIGSYWLLRTPPPEAPAAATFMAAALVVAVAIWILRIVFVWNVERITRDAEAIDLTIALFGVAQIAIGVACTMALFWIEMRKVESVLTKVAFTDALTELPNRRAIVERFLEEESKAVRHGTQFAMLVLDIDNYKLFNDRHGHLAGDAVLRHVAGCLARARRAGDALGRVGGEEFVMLLAGDLTIAQGAAERLRAQVQNSGFECRGETLSITVSGGLAMFPADGVDWDKLFAVADRRLAQSRRSGRNRVTSVSEVAVLARAS